MQDLKHLTRKKRFLFFGSSRSNSCNKKLAAASARLAEQLSEPTPKKRQQLKYKLLFLAIVLALTPIFALILHKAPQFHKSISAWIKSKSGSITRHAEASHHKDQNQFGQASDLLHSATNDGATLSARTEKGDTIQYTINGGLQKRVHDYLASHNVPYGVFVAMEPATGKILAMTSFSAVNHDWGKKAYFETYPMASLFKLVTASAALENKKITPDTVIEYRGKTTSESPKYWNAAPRGRNNRLDITSAMGKSVNPVYGRVAADLAGKNSIMESVNRFGFNQALLPGCPAKESKAAEPADHNELMLMGAGLNKDVKISPLHAAMIIAAIANDGRMMTPGLTDKIVAANGKVNSNHTPQELRRLVSAETASSLTRIMSSTVKTGTSRKAFHSRKGKPLVNLDIAAKTGSITGDDPKGHYSWFAAFAPMHNPRIAVVALVINNERWKIKSSQVGEVALEEFFRQ